MQAATRKADERRQYNLEEPESLIRREDLDIVRRLRQHQGERNKFAQEMDETFILGGGRAVRRTSRAWRDEGGGRDLRYNKIYQFVITTC